MMTSVRIADSEQQEGLRYNRKGQNDRRPCGPGKTGADAPVISLRLRFLSPGRCLTVFSLCFLLLSVLLCCSCLSRVLFIKTNGINSLMAPFGSPALPGRQPHCANRLCR